MLTQIKHCFRQHAVVPPAETCVMEPVLFAINEMPEGDFFVSKTMLDINGVEDGCQIWTFSRSLKYLVCQFVMVDSVLRETESVYEY
jgi:hypothetical protein